MIGGNHRAVPEHFGAPEDRAIRLRERRRQTFHRPSLARPLGIVLAEIRLGMLHELDCAPLCLGCRRGGLAPATERAGPTAGRQQPARDQGGHQEESLHASCNTTNPARLRRHRFAFARSARTAHADNRGCFSGFAVSQSAVVAPLAGALHRPSWTAVASLRRHRFAFARRARTAHADNRGCPSGSAVGQSAVVAPLAGALHRPFWTAVASLRRHRFAFARSARTAHADSRGCFRRTHQTKAREEIPPGPK